MQHHPADPPSYSPSPPPPPPFSAGPRSCAGQALALLSLKTSVALLLTCFKLELSTVPGASGTPADTSIDASGSGSGAARTSSMYDDYMGFSLGMCGAEEVGGSCPLLIMPR